VQVGDVTVEPGDLVIADGSGVVFIPESIAETAIAKAEEIADRERQMVAAIHENRPVREVMGRDYETMLGTQD
jgi:regulator of RNase E activity RraA